MGRNKERRSRTHRGMSGATVSLIAVVRFFLGNLKPEQNNYLNNSRPTIQTRYFTLDEIRLSHYYIFV